MLEDILEIPTADRLLGNRHINKELENNAQGYWDM